MNSETKNCQNCKQSFAIEPDDFAFYEKISARGGSSSGGKVPPPTWCPECRLIRRLTWRNERAFYRRTCEKCHTSMISVYSEDSGIQVFCRPCWWSDSWDGLENGRDFDPREPFLEQLMELLRETPLPSLFGLYTTLENSEYTNMVGYLKNCYFLTMADYDENCAYGSYVFHSRDSFDTLLLDKSELCYETVNCRQCYATMFSIDCDSCHNVWFSKNCVGCSDCFGCVNLRNKKYHIFNKAYSKEEYEEKVLALFPTTHLQRNKAWDDAKQFWNTFPQKYIHERLTNNVSGDYLYNTKNTKDSFMVQDMEDSRFCSLVLPGGTAQCYDHTHYGGSSELMYETLQCGNQASRIIGSWFTIINVANVEHSIFAIGCKNVFGTVGLKKREYCILNKQYTKEEYESLRKKIIEQMHAMPYKDAQGHEYRYADFFPSELSPFGYNISGAQESFPLTENEAKKKGYKWKNPERGEYTITIPSHAIPESIEKVPVSMLKETFGCEHEGTCNEQCSTAFRITQAELDFYKRFNLPLPHLCPNCRHYARVEWRNPFKLWMRACNCGGKQSHNKVYSNTISHFHADAVCPNEFETSYSPERPETVYCEQCYNAEIV